LDTSDLIPHPTSRIGISLFLHQIDQEALKHTMSTEIDDIHKKENQKATKIPNETKWTDDSIRWSEDEQLAAEKVKAAASEEDESHGLFDIFKDGDPHENFSFRFELSSCDDDDYGPETATCKEVIDIELNGYKYSSDEIWQSTGLTLWRASEHLCRYLVKHRNDDMLDLMLRQDNSQRGSERIRILELGAGLGLVGILAHRISSPKSHVFITDGDTEALVCLRENVELNRIKQEANSKSSDNVGEVTCCQLLWGTDTSLAFLEQQNGEKIDVLLASDIVYSPVIIQPLWETVQCLLDSKGIFVFAYARRKVPVSIEDVLAAAEEAGFQYERCEESDDDEGIYIFTFRWKN